MAKLPAALKGNRHGQLEAIPVDVVNRIVPELIRYGGVATQEQTLRANRRHRREIGRPVTRRCVASAVRRLGLSAAAVDG